MRLKWILVLLLPGVLHASLLFESRFGFVDALRNTAEPVSLRVQSGGWNSQGGLYYENFGLRFGLKWGISRFDANVESLTGGYRILLSNRSGGVGVNAGWKDQNRAIETEVWISEGVVALSRFEISRFDQKQCFSYSYHSFSPLGFVSFFSNKVSQNSVELFSGNYDLNIQTHFLKHSVQILPFLNLRQQWELDFLNSRQQFTGSRVLMDALLLSWVFEPEWKFLFGLSDWKLTTKFGVQALLTGANSDSLTVQVLDASNYSLLTGLFKMTNYCVGITVRNACFSLGYEWIQDALNIQALVRSKEYFGIGVGEGMIQMVHSIQHVFVDWTFSPFEFLELYGNLSDFFTSTDGMSGNWTTGNLLSGVNSSENLQFRNFLLHLLHLVIEGKLKFGDGEAVFRVEQYLPIVQEQMATNSSGETASDMDHFDGGRVYEVILRYRL